MKEYLFNQPKFQERQVVSFRGQICLILMCSQEADMIPAVGSPGKPYTIFSYVLCDYFTHYDVLVNRPDFNYPDWRKKRDRRIPEDEILELTDEQKTKLTLECL